MTEALLQEILSELKELNGKTKRQPSTRAEHTKFLTIEEFAKAINVSTKTAYGMARCEVFNRLKISVNVSPGSAPQRGRIRKNAMWRLDIDKYREALRKNLI